MQDIFITEIDIRKVRNLENFNIELSQTEKKHLILTGKNGSGKTSLLEVLKGLFLGTSITFTTNPNTNEKIEWWTHHGVLSASLSRRYRMEDKILSAYIPATRSLNMEIPKSIEKFDIKTSTTHIDTDLSRDFLKYIIYLDYQLLRAKTNEDKQRLQKWFDRFESALKEIYDCPELQLEPIPDDLIFKVKMPNYEPFGLNEMADGYSAFLDIVIELMLRMDNGNAVVDTDLSGIVLIDEIETHLHIELQKKVLPFLIKMFPNIQFIVSTHSPFVISSISNAVLFDLENKRRVVDLTAYSWETIVESYFEVGLYSHEITEKFNKYKDLYYKERSHEEEKEFFKIRMELQTVSPIQKELYTAFRQMELKLSGKAGM